MMTPHQDVRHTIVQLLSNMSDGKEIRTYLSRFSQLDQSRFAVIKIGGAVLQSRLEETAAAHDAVEANTLGKVLIDIDQE